MINWTLMSSPVNWIIIILMIIIGGFGLALLGRAYSTNISPRLPEALAPQKGE